MKRQQKTGLLVNGSLRAAGVTIYTCQGRNVIRVAHSQQPRRMTKSQFDVRMRAKHCTALWGNIGRQVRGMIDCDGRPYNRFLSMGFALPVVYLPKYGVSSRASLLVPGIPISAGSLPPIGQHLGEVEGQPALLLDISPDGLDREASLLLCRLSQRTDGGEPRVTAHVDELEASALVPVGEGMAWMASELADPMGGWAVVRSRDGHHSTQTVQTACTYYRHYTTAQAQAVAAESYGGFTVG